MTPEDERESVCLTQLGPRELGSRSQALSKKPPCPHCGPGPDLADRGVRVAFLWGGECLVHVRPAGHGPELEIHPAGEEIKDSPCQ